jgi:hypothetical protein
MVQSFSGDVGAIYLFTDNTSPIFVGKGQLWNALPQEGAVPIPAFPRQDVEDQEILQPINKVSLHCFQMSPLSTKR